ncbi:MAG: ERCC4 domain-containing protein [Puniceicoccaceae bacterium]
MNQKFKPYTVRRTPVRLTEIEPVVLVDTREQTPLKFTRLRSEQATLTTGDYSFAGGENQLCIERKSIPDLVACCMGKNRDRFFRELHRMRGFDFARLLVIGTRDEIKTGQYRSAIRPSSVLATLSTIEARFNVPIVFQPDPFQAAWQVEEWVWWYARELIFNTNKLLPSRKQ